MQPAHARATEEGVPVDVARAQLAGCCVTPVGDADGAADTEPPFGEVQAVPDVPTDSVVRRPAHERGVDSALEHEVLDEAPDVVVRQGGDDRGAQPEAASQSAGHVVLAPAFPDLELAGGADPTLARIEAQHHFAEGDSVEVAVGGGAQLQAHAPTPVRAPRTTRTAAAARSVICAKSWAASRSADTSQDPPTARTDGSAR